MTTEAPIELLTDARQFSLTGARQSCRREIMEYEKTLHWYRQNRFTADDVTRATGLSERSQRELLKLGVIQAVPQPNPKAQRLVTDTMLKRAAIAAPLTKAGLSLGVAGRIVYAAMMLEDLIFDIVDPWDVFYDAASTFDPETGLYEPRKLPHNRDTWFDPARRPAAEDDDFRICIVDSKYVLLGVGKPDAAYGELTPDLTDFLWWENSMYDHIRALGNDGVLHLSVKGIGDHSPVPFGTFDVTENPKTLTFRTKAATEKDGEDAGQAYENPTSLLTINASLALRIALRRLLHIDEVPAS